jgi:hypothetical protein
MKPGIYVEIRIKARLAWPRKLVKRLVALLVKALGFKFFRG